MTMLALRRLSESACDFIDEARFDALLRQKPSPGEVRDAVAKALAKTPLEVEETAALLRAEEPDQLEEVFDAARRLKRDVYGLSLIHI